MAQQLRSLHFQLQQLIASICSLMFCHAMRWLATGIPVATPENLRRYSGGLQLHLGRNRLPFGATGRKGCSLRAAVFDHADLQKFRVSGWSSLRRSQSRHTNTLPHYLKRSGGCPISCRAKSCTRAIDGESLRLVPFPTLPVLQ